MTSPRASNRARRRSTGGFTLIELMITFSIVAIGLLSVLMMQLQAMRYAGMGRHRTGAAIVARDQIERIQRMPFSDTALDVMSPATWATPPWLANTSDATLGPGEVPVQVTHASGTERLLVYTVWYLVSADDPGDPDPDLRRVDLEVLWTEQGMGNNKPTRTGQPTVAISTMLVNNDR